MHVISFKRLRAFWALHPDAETPLRAWYREARHATWENFAAVRASYPSADRVGKLTVFNIGGNKYRLVVHIRHDKGRIYVRAVLPHKEYDLEHWKDE